MSQKSKQLNVEPIEDVEVDKDLQYIQELENEINDLTMEVKSLKKQLTNEPKNIDYKIKYYQLVKTFQTTLEEFLPF